MYMNDKRAWVNTGETVQWQHWLRRKGFCEEIGF